MMENTAGNPGRRPVPPAWGMYEDMDRVRLRQGRWLDAIGWGPRETPSRTVFRRPGLALKAYGEAAGERAGEAAGEGPVLLIVPAPIKRAYIWDLEPGASVVQASLARGLRPYLVQWEAPEPQAGLGEFADGYLDECARAIEADCGAARVVLAGHSLGGVLAAIFASLHPERAAGLVLLGTPLHYSPGREQGALGPAARAPGAEEFLETLPDRVPGSVMSMAGFMASPAAFGKERWSDWWKSLGDRGAMATHLRVERWTLDELPLAGRLVEDILRQLYGADAFMAGTLRCGQRTASAAAVAAPLLAVIEPHCAIVPPSAILPFVEKAASREKRLVRYDGDVGVAIQHVGALVGRTAHARLWPEILDWIHALRTGPNLG